MKKVMVFGVFDGVHDGHRVFFKEAKMCGDYLIAVVAQDNNVRQLKGHLPQAALAARIANLKKEDMADEIVAGDFILGTYGVVKKHRPDIIALGYDQHAFKKHLESKLKEFSWNPKVVVMNAHKPETYHSSLLNK